MIDEYDEVVADLTLVLGLRQGVKQALPFGEPNIRVDQPHVSKYMANFAAAEAVRRVSQNLACSLQLSSIKAGNACHGFLSALTVIHMTDISEHVLTCEFDLT